MEAYDSEALLGKLIAFDTTSRLSNLELIQFICDYLAGHGVASRVIEDRSRTKATLFATIGLPDRASGQPLTAGPCDPDR